MKWAVILVASAGCTQLLGLDNTKFLYKDGPERKTYSDSDASWGHRSAISTRTGPSP